MESNNLYYYGPKVWTIIHKYAYQNNKNDVLKICYSKMIEHILQLFPCSICQTHFSEILKKYPLKDYKDIFFWSFKIHNDVNIVQKKISSPCIQSCEKLYASMSRNEIVKSLFDVVFTFISTGVSGIIIKNFLLNVAQLNEDEVKKNILYLIKIHYSQNSYTVDWVYKIYIDLCKRFNIESILDKDTCISFFGIKRSY